MNIDTPLVSIIIPTYSRPLYLKRAIDSVLIQTYNNIELIVVDDNNPLTDDRRMTEHIMMEYSNNSKVIYVQHLCNKNGSAARNTGIRKSNGKYIAFLDDDDYFFPGKIEKQVQCMEDLSNEWGLCYCKYIRKKNDVLFDKSKEKREGFLIIEALKNNFYISAGSNILIRRCIIEDVGLFNEKFKRRQDLEYLVRILQKYKIAYVDYCGVVIDLDDSRNREQDVNIIKKRIEEYLDNFKTYIDDQNAVTRDEIILSQKMLIVQFYLKQGKIIQAQREAKKMNIPAIVNIRFMFYLLRRKLSKTCYGFSVSK